SRRSTLRARRRRFPSRSPTYRRRERSHPQADRTALYRARPASAQAPTLPFPPDAANRRPPRYRPLRERATCTASSFLVSPDRKRTFVHLAKGSCQRSVSGHGETPVHTQTACATVRSVLKSSIKL